MSLYNIYTYIQFPVFLSILPWCFFLFSYLFIYFPDTHKSPRKFLSEVKRAVLCSPEVQNNLYCCLIEHGYSILIIRLTFNGLIYEYSYKKFTVRDIKLLSIVD